MAQWARRSRRTTHASPHNSTLIFIYDGKLYRDPQHYNHQPNCTTPAAALANLHAGQFPDTLIPPDEQFWQTTKNLFDYGDHHAQP